MVSTGLMRLWKGFVMADVTSALFFLFLSIVAGGDDVIGSYWVTDVVVHNWG